MISLSSVSKRFASVQAVTRLTFKAKQGEIIGFLGPNGAGKTTTMRLIIGYLRPTEGNILVDGYSPSAQRLEVVKRIGYLPENNPLSGEMNVEEYLRFIADIKEVKEYMTIIKNVGLDEVLSQKIDELSRGYRQRVGLAAALIGDPPILILDEPTSGLDPLEQDKIRHFIKTLATKKTIIFSTHILSEVEAVASRLVILNRGQLVYDGVKPRGKGAVETLFKKWVKD